MHGKVRDVGLLCGVLGLLVSSGAEAKIPPKLMGKVFFTTSEVKDQSTEALVRLFTGAKTKLEVPRNKKGRWPCTMVAFFRKPAVRGPITLLYFDRADKEAIKAREATDVQSVEGKETQVFIHDLSISPDRGFNKGRTYLIQVGQIIGKQTKIYASGDVTLQP